MQQAAPGVSGRLLSLSQAAKRTILVASDVLVLLAVMFSVVWLRRFALVETTTLGYVLMALAPVISVVIFAMLGLYRLVTRDIGHRGHVRIAVGVALATLIWSLLVFMTGQQGIPRSTIPLYFLFGTGVVVASRQAAAVLLGRAGAPSRPVPGAPARIPVLIYGAGANGVRLLEAVKGDPRRAVIGLIDSDTSMWGQYAGGVTVYPPGKIAALIEDRDVREVLIALSATQRDERRRVLDLPKGQPVAVKVLPALEDIATGRVDVSDLRTIDVDDLLGRDPVPPNAGDLARCVKDKSILVTGAGGSVGSELVRQILRQGPAGLVLFDSSEYALYQIELEVRELVSASTRHERMPHVAMVLGSVEDEVLVRETLRRYHVETVYHAAAYKHVPIVEANPITGLANNVFGTQVLARCAEAAGVERVVLISTDKAVRPTNVMGPSKRVAELILQAQAAEPGCRTIFTMVRFGNVLDSSGSVVALFRRQIRAGGPVTVTHPDVIRSFMSISEAAALVMQAGAMASGGDVFVLDMGDPVKIDDLARLMIRLSGLEVKTADTPKGDVEIVYTGLRPGEKLFEELLIGANMQHTDHPRILRSGEPFLPAAELTRELDLLRSAMATRDIETVQAVLQRTVEGYKPDARGAGSRPLPAQTYLAQSRAIH